MDKCCQIVRVDLATQDALIVARLLHFGFVYYPILVGIMGLYLPLFLLLVLLLLLFGLLDLGCFLLLGLAFFSEFPTVDLSSVLLLDLRFFQFLIKLLVLVNFGLCLFLLFLEVLLLKPLFKCPIINFLLAFQTNPFFLLLLDQHCLGRLRSRLFARTPFFELVPGDLLPDVLLL